MNSKNDEIAPGSERSAAAACYAAQTTPRPRNGTPVRSHSTQAQHKMIPTPRTEGEIIRSLVDAEFARQLERHLYMEEACGVIKKEEIKRLNTLRRTLELAIDRAIATLVSVLESFGAPPETIQAAKSGDAEHVCFWAEQAAGRCGAGGSQTPGDITAQPHNDEDEARRKESTEQP